MRKLQHVYWFAPYNLTCPSTRYRGKYPLEWLEEHQGITFDFVTPDRSFRGVLHFLNVYLMALFFRKKDSLIVIQKVCSLRWYAKALKLLISIRNQDTLYDIDDAEYYRQPTPTLHFFLKNCQQIQVGSKALQDYCLQYNTNVHIATSPVIEHVIHKQKKNDLFTIGWVGDLGNGKAVSKDFSHKSSLFKLFFPVLKTIDFPLKLMLIGVKQPEDIPEIELYFKDKPNISLEIPVDLDWTSDGWLYEQIKTFDLGVSPMVDHPFNQAKSAFKAKQYLSCAVPVLASDVGENRNYVLDQKNGWICSQSEDFYKGIKAFYSMNRADYRQYQNHSLAHLSTFSMKSYCMVIMKNFNSN